jgi:hypothetical protein
MTIGAPSAERALEAADPSVGALGQQVDVAALTIRSKLEHDQLLERSVSGWGS